ncbi:MAG: galactose mutarotase [Micropruina sp.]|nr:galactose mutarotase [Micropruina sp.]
MTTPSYRTAFGTVQSRPVERVRLQSGALSVDLITVGAAVHRVIVDGRDVALGHPDAETYARSQFCIGLTVGRFANRIGGGRFTLDGVEYRLATNEGDNTLHGGPDGFHRRLWTIDEQTDDSVTFGLVSPEGDQGFPGELTASVRYTISPDELRMDYRATTTAPTVVNFTNHSYFNLAGEASGSSDGLTVWVPASRVVEVDDELIPTGRLVPVGSHDLRTPRPVAEAAPLDTCFVIDAADGSVMPHATLASSDLALDVFSDQPGIQLYTADVMDGVPGLSGPYGPRAGVALETQNLPDAPNHADFPNSVLRPGEEFRSTTSWRFRRLS